MKLAVMQPYIFPYIGYFQLINLADKFVLYDDVNYINKGWINRNNILISGKPGLFTIPLNQASQNKLINDISISNEEKWKIKFLKTIQNNYSKSPFFGDIFPMIERIIYFEDKNISRFIFNSLSEINHFLEIKTEIIPSSSIYQNGHLKAQDRILNICEKENANCYINPIGGMELYSKEIFTKKNITLNFIKSKPLNYQQFSNEFTPSLSIIDILMFNKKDAIGKFLNEYELT